MTTQTEINRSVHEAMGRGEWQPYHHADDNAPDAVKGWRNIQSPSPDYCSDLNAAAEFEAFVIEKVGRSEYYGFLEYQVMPTGDLFSKYWVMMATAEQRCRAGLAALGLLEEGDDGTGN